MTSYTQRGREREKTKKSLKERIGDESFTAIPSNFLRSDALKELSGTASKLLLEFLRQLGKNNNGDLQASWQVLKDRGWNSKSTLHKAITELRKAGIITQTRQGGRNRCSLYALTFVAIDDCKGKHDARPSRRPLGLWHEERKEYRDIIAKPSKEEKESA